MQQGKVDFAKYQEGQEERLQRFAADHEQALQALAKAESNLPSDIQHLYDLEVQRRGEDAMAPVENRTCVACYTEITAQMYNDLIRESYVKCKSCGRILYLPDGN